MTEHYCLSGFASKRQLRELKEMNLLAKAKKMPLASGVYLFLNKRARVLYVGRATSLKRRVLSYFQKNLEPRMEEMIRLAVEIKYKKTANILEAIILEANVIKRYWPKYNVKERDNRSFVYIVIPKTAYPRPFLARLREVQKFSGPARDIFGPYQSLALIKKALRLIRRIFPFSTCKINSGRPCFDYQLGLCPGACVGKITGDDYQKNIDNLILFLKGEKKKLFKKLKTENPFQIECLKHIQDAALIAREERLTPFGAKRIEGYDVSHLAGRETIGAMVTFKDGQPDEAYYRLFKVRQAPANDDLRALEEIISRRLNHREWPLPDLIVIDGGQPQVDYLFRALRAKKINIPLVGISKFANDRLTFPPRLRKSNRELLETTKETFLKVRNEAHRFALKNSRRQRKLIQKTVKN